ncbi:MAG: hypothetical protein K0S65_3970 [Labilithrix sp.]|nr:hypothetical protein [Labilithrix sp.]
MMKTMRLVKSVFFVAAMLMGTAACGDDEDSGGGQQQATSPREVTVEYKVTSTSGLTKADVTYVNESGGRDTADDVALPFTKQVTRTVKQFDNLALSVSADVGGSLTAEILVDGKSVDTKTFSGTSIIFGSSVYVFP